VEVVLIPAGTKTLIDRDHKVLVEKEVGATSGFSDSEYREVGGKANFRQTRARIEVSKISR